jgi:hypothetical protein
MLTLWLERRVHFASGFKTTVDAQEQSDARIVLEIVEDE